jgi:hypothetical protein
VLARGTTFVAERALLVVVKGEVGFAYSSRSDDNFRGGLFSL